MNDPQAFDYAPAGFAPPIALAASGAAFDRARAALEDAGALTCALDPDHLRPPAWLELDGPPGPIEEALIAGLDRMAREEGLGAVICAPRAALDPLAALVSSPGVEVLIDPDPLERAAAAAMLAAFASRPAGRAHEAGTAPGLRALSEEVSRIAAALAKLSEEGGASRVSDRIAPLTTADGPRVDPERVRAAVRERRLRSRFFEPALFADPAWDMLLDLFSAELSSTRVPVSSLCAAAEVPPTTALRWIRAMQDQGLFERRADPSDARRAFIALSRQASSAMRAYFAELAKF